VKFVYSPEYCADIGPHVFPTQKYRLIHEELTGEGLVNAENLYCPVRPAEIGLRKILTREYLDDLLNARMTARTMASELPVKNEVIDWQILGCGGSYLAAKLALECGACYHIGGGLHHAFADHAEGFCYLNDVVYAAVMMLEQGVNKLTVVDCDLHQGNGTARFFQDEGRVFTFSIHQEHLYPKKERSDLDIGLDLDTGDEEYLALLGGALDRIYGEFKPEFTIYLAGADPYMFDQLGNLQLTIEGLVKRDEMVLKRAFDHANPVVVVLGGGYAQEIEDTVEIHCNTAREMKKIWG
jgi:acetoin utilization deacetylase AcuC-like enzyme